MVSEKAFKFELFNYAALVDNYNFRVIDCTQKNICTALLTLLSIMSNHVDVINQHNHTFVIIDMHQEYLYVGLHILM